jgi:hypothetical protein
LSAASLGLCVEACASTPDCGFVSFSTTHGLSLPFTDSREVIFSAVQMWGSWVWGPKSARAVIATNPVPSPSRTRYYMSWFGSNFLKLVIFDVTYSRGRIA